MTPEGLMLGKFSETSRKRLQSALQKEKYREDGMGDTLACNPRQLRQDQQLAWAT